MIDCTSRHNLRFIKYLINSYKFLIQVIFLIITISLICYDIFQGCIILWCQHLIQGKMPEYLIVLKIANQQDANVNGFYVHVPYECLIFKHSVKIITNCSVIKFNT